MNAPDLAYEFTFRPPTDVDPIDQASLYYACMQAYRLLLEQAGLIHGANMLREHVLATFTPDGRYLTKEIVSISEQAWRHVSAALRPHGNQPSTAEARALLGIYKRILWDRKVVELADTVIPPIDHSVIIPGPDDQPFSMESELDELFANTP